MARKIYVCDHCGKEYVGHGDMQKHQDNKHEGKEQSYSVQEQRDVTDHIQGDPTPGEPLTDTDASNGKQAGLEQHGFNPPTYKCGQCNRPFKTMQARQMHEENCNQEPRTVIKEGVGQ